LLLQLKDYRVRTAYLFIAPFMIFFLVFVLVPILGTVLLSFNHWTVLEPPSFAGVQNYIRLLHDRYFWNSLKNTIYYSLGTTVGGVILSFVIAVIIDERWFRGKTFFKTIYFLPTVTSVAAIAYVWMLLYSPNFGLLNFMLSKLGLPPSRWLSDPNLAMPSMIVLGIWKSLGYNIVIFLAGLQGIPGTLYDAAAVDGANRLGQIRYLTIPLLLPVSTFITVMNVISSFQVFDQIFLMTGGGPLRRTEVIVYYIYQQGFHLLKMGYASAMAMALFIVILGFTIVQFRFFNTFGQR
jgi:multiple sugar transport system permease protein